MQTLVILTGTSCAVSITAELLYSPFCDVRHMYLAAPGKQLSIPTSLYSSALTEHVQSVRRLSPTQIRLNGLQRRSWDQALI